MTISHLRFGPQPIGSSYEIETADYLAVHHAPYIQKFDVLSKLAPGGTLVLNTVRPVFGFCMMSSGEEQYRPLSHPR